MSVTGLEVVDPIVHVRPQIVAVVDVVVHVTAVGARVIGAIEIVVIDTIKTARGRGRVTIVVAARGVGGLVLEVRLTTHLVGVTQYRRRIGMIAKPPQVILGMLRYRKNAAQVVLALRMVKKLKSRRKMKR